MSHSTVPRPGPRRRPTGRRRWCPAAPPHSDKKRPGKLSLRLRLRRDRTLILMTLPAVLLLLVFNYVPLLGNVVAFQDYDPYVSDNGFVAMFAEPLGRPGALPADLRRTPLFWHARTEHLRAVLPPAGAVLPDPDRARAAHQQRDQAPGPGGRPGDHVPARTSSRGCWSSPSSSRSSAARASSRRPCATTGTTAST